MYAGRYFKYGVKSDEMAYLHYTFTQSLPFPIKKLDNHDICMVKSGQ